MSKRIKETQTTVLRSRILNYSPCCRPPTSLAAHKMPSRSFTATHQNCSARHHTRESPECSQCRDEDAHHAFLADTNCSISTRVQYHLALGLQDTRLGEEQPQQHLTCCLGSGSTAVQKQSEHPAAAAAPSSRY